MKTRSITFAFFILLILSSACTKDNDPGFRTANEDMLIIPAHPTIADEIKIVDQICNYEALKSITINGTQINYTRAFNSMMKMPCTPIVDTVSIGQLNEGDYMICYKLIDISSFVTDSIAGIDTLYFSVSK